MSNTNQAQPDAVSVPNTTADAASRIVVAEVITRTFSYGGWVPKLRWHNKPAVGAKLYAMTDAAAPDGKAQYAVVGEVVGSSVSYGEEVAQVRWTNVTPMVGAKLYQDVVADPAAQPSSGADYKGHANLAEMLVTHLDSFRRALKFQRGHAKDADDRSWFDHELAALLDIETACRADIKAARESKVNPAKQPDL